MRGDEGKQGATPCGKESTEFRDSAQTFDHDQSLRARDSCNASRAGRTLAIRRARALCRAEGGMAAREVLLCRLEFTDKTAVLENSTSTSILELTLL
jgi:hypothetical protein